MHVNAKKDYTQQKEKGATYMRLFGFMPSDNYQIYAERETELIKV